MRTVGPSFRWEKQVFIDRLSKIEILPISKYLKLIIFIGSALFTLCVMEKPLA